MISKHLCPCCSQPLLRHVSSKRIYWFCRQCHQEMPDIENILEEEMSLQHCNTNNRESKLVAARDGKSEKRYSYEGKKLQHLASSESLTKIANRIRFQAYLDREWRCMAWKQTSLSLILGELDFFKTYNDTYGCQAGSKCLQQIANAIVSAVKCPADIVPRYGGEEFIVILPNTKAEDAVQIAEEIRLAIKGLKLAEANSQLSNYLTVSLGIASIIPTPEYPAAMLISAADQALYQAKAQGRDRVVVYETLLRQTKVVESEKTPAIQPSNSSTLALASEEIDCASTKMELLMSYVAYYMSRGKKVISPMSGCLSFEGSVYQYWGYHQDFQDFWQQLEQYRDFRDFYIEGDLYCFGQFLNGSCTVDECSRCSLPIPKPIAGVNKAPNCTLCIESWLCYKGLDHQKLQAEDELSITRIVAIGTPPTDEQDLEEWFSLNRFKVTFISKPEEITLQSLPSKVDLVLIHESVSEAQGKAWAQRLGHYSQFKGVPIIALSAEAGHGLPWTERTLGIQDYILTPHNGDRLACHLRQVLQLPLSKDTAELHWFPR